VGKKIAVLFHERARGTDLAGYIVDHLAGFWREDGHEVLYLFGTKDAPPADVLFVHVDLSVVPDEYLSLAARYPVALNHRVRDIRKSVTSRNLVRPGDGWNGPVIVKSDLNFGGTPERLLAQTRLQRRSRAWRGLTRAGARLFRPAPLGSSEKYVLFEHPSEVPKRWFELDGVVVERFLPELENGLYHLRMYQFLGDRWTCTLIASQQPVIRAGTSVAVEQIEPHAEVIAWREQLGIDYGKLDYVVQDGEVVLLDVNKTTGASRHMPDDALRRMRRHFAEGLYSYF
jgi:hypothetical protein